MKSLLQKLNSLERQLEKVRGIEYSLPFGSMKRARVSRKWDELAKEKYKVAKLYEESCTSDSVRNCDIKQHDECDCTIKCMFNGGK